MTKAEWIADYFRLSKTDAKGDHVVEVKPGEEVLSVNVSWTVEKFVEEEKKENGKKGSSEKERT